jgi:hypothetical protein
MTKPSQHEFTSELIQSLFDQGIRRMTVLIRHAARCYDTADPLREPFQPLTEQGKADAYEFGRRLPAASAYRFFSSPVGRCIETAYQIEKGCIERGAKTRVNVVTRDLSAFYIKDFLVFFARYLSEGPETVLRTWFEGRMPPEIQSPPDEAIRTQIAAIRALLSDGDAPQIDIGITHDWTLYLVQEMCLNERFEDVGPAGYLEGIVFFERDGVLHATNSRSETKPIAPDFE